MITETESKSIPYSDEQINEYYEVFSFFDRHNTGRINLNELGLIIRSIGFNPSDLLVKQFQHEYEQNDIEKINFQQFLQILIYFTNEIEDEIDIIEAFRVFDKEGQGFISKEELMHIMTHLGEKLSMEEAEEMMHDADIYCDGKIRYEEFVKIMTQLN
ncbi:unnamed protein product [Rotaria sp. Silwood2]|nr:unnamed protein product [Rotaria sp. Silwood2]CAF2772352.1 unnamed protein product [Rotaria sp. Silwood2]CAF2947340.1 unnamed protein product [Rotaria sp. Silwood2]CAF3887160.1 unnamed protein product [Rotaria sp. Silwood2]CAF3947063.1 unnamed protein product [Rotaria sp. Silwood2]